MGWKERCDTRCKSQRRRDEMLPVRLIYRNGEGRGDEKVRVPLCHLAQARTDTGPFLGDMLSLTALTSGVTNLLTCVKRLKGDDGLNPRKRN